MKRRLPMNMHLEDVDDQLTEELERYGSEQELAARQREGEKVRGNMTEKDVETRVSELEDWVAGREGSGDPLTQADVELIQARATAEGWAGDLEKIEKEKDKIRSERIRRIALRERRVSKATGVQTTRACAGHEPTLTEGDITLLNARATAEGWIGDTEKMEKEKARIRSERIRRASKGLDR